MTVAGRGDGAIGPSTTLTVLRGVGLDSPTTDTSGIRTLAQRA
jgi:hypothetical protein